MRRSFGESFSSPERCTNMVRGRQGATETIHEEKHIEEKDPPAISDQDEYGELARHVNTSISPIRRIFYALIVRSSETL